MSEAGQAGSPAAPLLLVWRDDGAVSARNPLAFVIPPGPALLRANVPWIEFCENPSRSEIDRIARGFRGRVHALFDLDSMPHAVPACRILRRRHLSTVAARGRVVPELAADAFESLWLGENLLDAMRDDLPVPSGWTHPLVLADVWCRNGRSERVGVVFGRLPEAGLLDVRDVGRAGVREGAPASALRPTKDDTASDLGRNDVDRLLEEYGRLGFRRVLLVDNGGSVPELAEHLLSRGVLCACFGAARDRPPDAAVSHGVPLFSWFEPEDLDDSPVLRDGGRACAFVPIASDFHRVEELERRIRGLRARGYSSIVPRYHLPVPGTREWQRVASRYPIEAGAEQSLDGSRPLFAVPGWASADPEAQLRRFAVGDPVADGCRSDRAMEPRYSLSSLRTVLDGLVAGARGARPDHHAREVVEGILRDAPLGDLEPLERYPFAAFRGRSLLDIVNSSIEARLRSIAGGPDVLVRAMRYTGGGGGKRIRPVLSVLMGIAERVPLDAMVPAALVVEWFHTASLIQDDLPSMDDDGFRRSQPSAHVRHGEGMALLASDALVAMAFEDLAALAHHPAVGPDRAAHLVAASARAIGVVGLAGGQARDLLLGGAAPTLEDLLEVHRRKTAPLFRLAATIPAVLAGFSDDRRMRAEARLADLGVAFQIVDDVLDQGAEAGRPGDDAATKRHRRGANVATLLRRHDALQLAESLVRPLVAYANDCSHLLGLGRLATFVVNRQA